MPSDPEEAATGAADAMAAATSRLRKRGWMISAVTQPILAAPVPTTADPEHAGEELSA